MGDSVDAVVTAWTSYVDPDEYAREWLQALGPAVRRDKAFVEQALKRAHARGVHRNWMAYLMRGADNPYQRAAIWACLSGTPGSPLTAAVYYYLFQDPGVPKDRRWGPVALLRLRSLTSNFAMSRYVELAQAKGIEPPPVVFAPAEKISARVPEIA